MGKIAIIAPTEDLLKTAHNYCQQHPEYDIVDIQRTTSKEAVMTARKMQAAGVDIVIARGLQASLIRKYTTLPTVEMVITAQEMAILVMQAKKAVNKEIPVIAVCGITNMFCDMSYFNELFDVDLRTYYADDDLTLTSTIQQAIADRVDVIIGGETAVAMAYRSGIASLFLSTTEDSLKMALMRAKYTDEMLTMSKKNAAEMETVLDYSYSGIMRIDSDGIVQSVNLTLEQMVDLEASQLIGKTIKSLIPTLSDEFLTKVLKQGQEDSLILEWNKVSLYVIFAPVIYDGNTHGAILTLQRTQKKMQGGQKEEKQSDLAPTSYFEDIVQISSVMKKCVDTARLYALSDRPVVFMGEVGTERRILAEAIHNASDRKKGPFVDISCAGLSTEEQYEVLFGEKGHISRSSGGTLLLQDVESLTISNQYRLYRLIRFHSIYGNEIGQLRPIDVRIMVTTQRPLKELVKQGIMREDLYYLLTGMELCVPPLRQRPEDYQYYFETRMKALFKKYGRYHVLTNGAKKLLKEYPWPGNIFQLDCFCERLVLTAGKRSIDEVTTMNILHEIYGSETENEKEELSYLDERKEEILKVLKRNHGNREKSAEELGISTTTLWRQMKKYGIDLK